MAGVTPYDVAKRALDLLVAVAALVLFLPAWLTIALAVRLTSQGPVLYVADAVGRHGKVFHVYKFRTMRAGNDEAAHRQYLATFVKEQLPYAVMRRPDGREAPVYKIVGDPRFTPIGRFLRATGLDEVPQFLNVLRGQMSVVGPRPPRVAEYQHYADWHKQRLAVLPGITGLYQITARSTVPFDEMVRIDLLYIKQRSLWLDLRIMFRTAFVMVQRKGGF